MRQQACQRGSWRVTLRTLSFSVSTTRVLEKKGTNHAFEEPLAPEEASKFPPKIDHCTPFFTSHITELWKHGSTEPYWDSVKMCRTSFTCCDHFVTSYRWSCLMEKRWRSLDAKTRWVNNFLIILSMMFVGIFSIFKKPRCVSRGSRTPLLLCFFPSPSLLRNKNQNWDAYTTLETLRNHSGVKDGVSRWADSVSLVVPHHRLLYPLSEGHIWGPVNAASPWIFVHVLQFY